MLGLAFNFASADVYLFNIHEPANEREPEREPEPVHEPTHEREPAHEREPERDHCSRIMAAFIFDPVAILYAVRTYQAMPLD